MLICYLSLKKNMTFNEELERRLFSQYNEDP